ncbi:uncharacterized protein [Diadema antillarum]|uniref:uncharacterized protein n=1 Tax=Diadema antillarum TaxID=105358 RepID=UPI003A880388
MDDNSLAIQSIWIHVASFCTVGSIGKLRTTCKYLNEVLSSNSVWKTIWSQLCLKHGLETEKMRELECRTPVPRMYENLCFRLVMTHRDRGYAQQWFVVNAEGELEGFDIVDNLRCFSFFDSTRLRKKVDQTRPIRIRSTFSTVVPIRKSGGGAVDALTDFAILQRQSVAPEGQELWPFGEKKLKAVLSRHRMPMMMRKKADFNEHCLSELPSKSCGMPPDYCSLSLMGSGWRLKRRLAATGISAGETAEQSGETNNELCCRVIELLKPGVFVTKGMPNTFFKSPFQLGPEELKWVLHLFFHVMGFERLTMFNLALHVSTRAQAETCLVIESYRHHTLVTPVVDGVVLPELVRHRQVGFAHVLDYLVLSINGQRAVFGENQVSTSCLQIKTDPERLHLAIAPRHAIRAAYHRECRRACSYSNDSYLGYTHYGTAIQLKDSIVGVLRGDDTCRRSELMMLFATEYMYRCLDLVSMVMEILLCLDTATVRQMLGRIFLVGENTRIAGFQVRFQKDLLAARSCHEPILDPASSTSSDWPVYMVHVDVDEQSLAEVVLSEGSLPNAHVLDKVDYVLHGPDVL